ncbi:hypothetical protein OSB04_002709 [Centaurea solstitialis]|uniref:Uncharacterized protein n=1 Tax=Centaurea solstitialis TaxID=347529 RepID=A0AA38TTD9_9ASTR|nr:hypothetical protein OSB04_002709 [Centaurea solstitialis]
MATLSIHTTRIISRHPKLQFSPNPTIKISSSLFFTKSPTKTLSYSVSESSVSSPVESEPEPLDVDDDDPTAELSYLDPETDPESITEWELDFCSRPILDIRGKKIWELVACDTSLSLQYTKYFPNNVINSVTLKDAIVSICDELDVPLPDKIRFFRSQMQTIITKACKELGIKPIPSKRCLSLLLWLEERYETIYTRHPGFQKGSKPLLALDNPFPMDLPDSLYGEKWAFVQLPFSDVKKELLSQEKTFAFGATLDLDLLGIEMDDETLIPGLAVASSRARPLAAWMNGLEVCSVEADLARANLVLSVGISTRYVYASYKKSSVTTSEAEAWEAAKKTSGGLHFLAIQDTLDSDDCVGFWLLLDLPPSPV